MRKTRLKVWRSFWCVFFNVPDTEIDSLGGTTSQKDVRTTLKATAAVVDPAEKTAYFVNLKDRPLAARARIAAHEAAHMVDPNMRHDKVAEIGILAEKLFERLL